MANNCLKYKGFIGSVEFDLEEGILFGKIECINDLVTYEAQDLETLKQEFEDSVEDYLETCEMLGKEPDKTMSGTFNVRIGAELHRKVFVKAKEQGKSLNDFIREQLVKGVEEIKQVHVIHKDVKGNVYRGGFGDEVVGSSQWTRAGLPFGSESLFRDTYKEH